MLAVERIIVPVDFSECSHAAARFAVFLGRRLQAAVELIHVIEPNRQPWSPAEGAAATPHDHSPLDGVQAEALLQRWAGRIGPEWDVDVRTRVLHGERADAILQLIEREGYDLVVMGTQGRTGMSYALLGGLTKTLVRRATCPVLSVPMPHLGLVQGMKGFEDEDLARDRGLTHGDARAGG